MVREFRELTETTAAKVSRLTADVNQRLNDIGVHWHNERHELKLWAHNLFEEQNVIFSSIEKDIKAL